MPRECMRRMEGWSDRPGFRRARPAASGTAGTTPALFSRPASMFWKPGRASVSRSSNWSNRRPVRNGLDKAPGWPRIEGSSLPGLNATHRDRYALYGQRRK